MPQVARFRNGNQFYRFSISENTLMAEYDRGYEWWVIGYIKDPSQIDLPKWEPKHRFKR